MSEKGIPAVSMKNKQGREVKMTPAVRELLTQCVFGKPADAHVFTRSNGKPVRDFRKIWDNVCAAAGVPDLLFHDLRRTAARNLRSSGVAEGVIMKLGGWETRSVFERYAIVTSDDLAQAVDKLEARKREFGQSLGNESTRNGAGEKQAKKQ